ncbi:hypothetical protein [Shewanella sp. GutDb-MelDb]|uniref:hypothetical protein n=1 Tax=Shewanella sp. GutDb-MelDb TaxID=2058316 RepID=UPI000C7D4559|nr:hypothetical protein [Shewanella sp. GutDb-MelDb]PKG55224.1 hypothetical protein CXF82_20555 [Shewanella sp. GutDb-MelDb]
MLTSLVFLFCTGIKQVVLIPVGLSADGISGCMNLDLCTASFSLFKSHLPEMDVLNEEGWQSKV